MNPGQWAVLLVALALIVGVNFYFFAPRRRAAAASATAGGPQEARIVVRDGYDPDVIQVRAGRPVRLVFRREEVEGCSDTVLLPEWKIAQKLPAHRDTVIEFTPATPGEYEFTCGMHMLRGKIVVR